MDVIALAQAGHRPCGRALGHGGDRAPARHPVAHGRGAGGLPRRRPCRARRRHARRRAGPAGDARRADAALRHPSRRRGPRQLSAPPWCRGAGGGVVESAHAVANDLAAGDARARFDTPEAARGAQPAAADAWHGWPAIRTCGRACWTSSACCRTSRRRDSSGGRKARPRKASTWDGVGPSRLLPASRGARRTARRRCSCRCSGTPDWLEGHEEELSRSCISATATSKGCARKSSRGSARRPALTRMHSRATSSDTV